MQTNFTGETVFLPVKRSNGNISDGSNQQVVRFQYGLPTANEIMVLRLKFPSLPDSISAPNSTSIATTASFPIRISSSGRH